MRLLKRKLISTSLALLLLFLSITPTYAQSNASSDISNHWAKDVLSKWVDNGLLAGDGNGYYRPDSNITRAEFVTIVTRIFNMIETTDINFKDVPKGAWYEQAVAKAYNAGIAGGDGSYFYPEKPISRQEAAVILYRAFDIKLNNKTAVDKFKDASDIAAWSKDALSGLVENGYISGRPGNLLAPEDNITRAESCKMIDNIMGELKNKEGTFSGDINTNLMVNTKNVALKNMTIAGNLYLTQGIGDGEVTLDNVTVKGQTYVKGGGEHSVIINNSSLQGTLTVLKKDGKIRIVAKGTSEVASVQLGSGAKLQEESISGKGFGNVEIINEVAAGQEIKLDGSFTDVSVAAPGVSIQVLGGSVNKLELTEDSVNTKVTVDGGNVSTLDVKSKSEVDISKGTVNTLNVDKKAEASIVQIDKDAVVSTLNAASKLTVSGQGQIGTANINAQGVKIEQTPGKTNVSNGTSANVGGRDVTGSQSGTIRAGGSSSGGSSGGNSGGNGSPQSITVNASDFSLTIGSKIIPSITVNPSDSTLSFSSANTAVATVNQTTGEITGIASGTSVITVNASKSGYTSASATFTVTVADLSLSAVSDKSKNGMYDPNGTFSYVDIDVFGSYYLTSAADKKEGFSVVADGSSLTVQSAEINGGSGQHNWMRVSFTPALNDFASMHIAYNQQNSNPIYKLDGTTKLPSFDLNVQKSSLPETVAATDPFADSTSTYTKSYQFTQSGTFGPATTGHIATIIGNVRISCPNVTLKNMVIKGDLTFDKDIGLGNATIINVTVEGNTIVNGGGSNSIHIQGTSTLGVVTVDDQRTDNSQPINISADGTGAVEAINVKNQTSVKVTANTDSIGYVAAVDGSTVSYDGTAENKKALLDRIVAKANEILDNAITGTDDNDYSINPNLDNIVSDIINIKDPLYQQYKIAYLKYYMNPLENVSEYATQYKQLSDKLQYNIDTTEVIDIRNDHSKFNATMYDDQFPDPNNPDVLVGGNNYGPNQQYVSGKKDVYDRVKSKLGLTDNGDQILNKLKALQTISVLHSVCITDVDVSHGITAGDKVVIIFKRQLSDTGKQAFEQLLQSMGSFGTNPTYLWDKVSLHAMSGDFDGSRCTITLGTAPSDIRNATITIPKDQLGSFEPAGTPKTVGWLTDMQPVFDIIVKLPGNLTT